MKIAISGAGVAGPALAFWLQRDSHEITLIERSPAFRTGGYMIDFWGVGYDIAERMGVLPAIRDAGYSVNEIRMVGSHGERVGGFPAEVFRQFTDDRFTSLPRGDLAHAVYAEVEAHIETLFGDSIVDLRESGDRVHLQLEHGGDRDVDLLVGADGLHSTVRELAFGPEHAYEKHLGYYVAAFSVEGYKPRDELVYVSFSRPGRQVARFAMRGDRTMFLFVFTAGRLDGPPPVDDASCRTTLRRLYGDLGWECAAVLDAMNDVDDIYLDRVSQIQMPRWSKDRIVLLGDAAACVSLMAGEGTGLALTEAYVLAGELQRAGGDHARAFRDYEQRLRPLITTKQASAARFASAFAPATAFGLWFRNQVSRLLGIRLVARYAIGQDIRDDIELPDYPL